MNNELSLLPETDKPGDVNDTELPVSEENTVKEKNEKQSNNNSENPPLVTESQFKKFLDVVVGTKFCFGNYHFKVSYANNKRRSITCECINPIEVKKTPDLVSKIREKNKNARNNS